MSAAEQSLCRMAPTSPQHIEPDVPLPCRPRTSRQKRRHGSVGHLCRAVTILWFLNPTTHAFQFPNFLGLNSPPPKSKTPKDMNDINEMEKEVLASARAKLDRQRAERIFLDNDDENLSSMSPLSMDPAKYMATTASPWQVSFAAASAVSSFVLLTTNASLAIAGIVFVVVFVAALGDPLEEDNATGAVARTVGRMTIRSVESSKPKLKAIAKAAISNQEEIALLKEQIGQLRREKDDLELWKQQRLAVEASISKYTLDKLKEIARENKLAVGGTKIQLMMRLVENGIELDLNPP